MKKGEIAYFNERNPGLDVGIEYDPTYEHDDQEVTISTMSNKLWMNVAQVKWIAKIVNEKFGGEPESIKRKVKRRKS